MAFKIFFFTINLVFVYSLIALFYDVGRNMEDNFKVR